MKATISTDARAGQLYALQSILVIYHHWTNTKPASFTAKTTGDRTRAKRYSLSAVPAKGYDSRESQAAYIAKLYAEEFCTEWPGGQYVIATTGRPGEYLFVSTERKALRLTRTN